MAMHTPNRKTIRDAVSSPSKQEPMVTQLGPRIGIFGDLKQLDDAGLRVAYRRLIEL